MTPATMTIQEVIDTLKIGRSTVMAAIKRDNAIIGVPVIRVGKRVLFSRALIEQAVGRTLVAPEPTPIPRKSTPVRKSTSPTCGHIPIIERQQLEISRLREALEAQRESNLRIVSGLASTIVRLKENKS